MERQIRYDMIRAGVVYYQNERISSARDGTVVRYLSNTFIFHRP